MRHESALILKLPYRQLKRLESEDNNVDFRCTGDCNRAFMDWARDGLRPMARKQLHDQPETMVLLWGRGVSSWPSCDLVFSSQAIDEFKHLTEPRKIFSWVLPDWVAWLRIVNKERNQFVANSR